MAYEVWTLAFQQVFLSSINLIEIKVFSFYESLQLFRNVFISIDDVRDSAYENVGETHFNYIDSTKRIKIEWPNCGSRYKLKKNRGTRRASIEWNGNLRADGRICLPSGKHHRIQWVLVFWQSAMQPMLKTYLARAQSIPYFQWISTWPSSMNITCALLNLHNVKANIACFCHLCAARTRLWAKCMRNKCDEWMGDKKGFTVRI